MDNVQPARRLTQEEDPSGVINEIGDEIDSGNAHLLTRNELVEFIEWLIVDERAEADITTRDGERDTAVLNDVLTEFMEYGDFDSHMTAWAEKIAKKFFIQSGYER